MRRSGFKLDLSGSNYQVLHLFTNNPDGYLALEQLIQAADGWFYGTTYLGGTNGAGTVYKFDANGNGYTVLHSFGGSSDGVSPGGGVAQGGDGALYGTTFHGGTNSNGTVFKLSPDGNNYAVLHNFSAADGIRPWASVTVGAGNVLYGVTTSAGANNFGTIFSLATDGNQFDVLYNFGGSPDGYNPYGTLAQGPATASTGVLYGTSPQGGPAGHGAIFALLVNPPLTITPVSGTANNQTVIFWPAWALHYDLQTTTNLPSGTWTTVSNSVPVTGVQVTNSAPGAFFRLVRP